MVLASYYLRSCNCPSLRPLWRRLIPGYCTTDGLVAPVVDKRLGFQHIRNLCLLEMGQSISSSHELFSNHHVGRVCNGGVSVWRSAYSHARPRNGAKPHHCANALRCCFTL